MVLQIECSFVAAAVFASMYPVLTLPLPPQSFQFDQRMPHMFLDYADSACVAQVDNRRPSSGDLFCRVTFHFS
jgi:hypothetical protein